MNSTTIRKLAPFSVNRQISVRPSNRNLEGRLRFSARFKPKIDFNVRGTPDPVKNIPERKSGLGLRLQTLSLALALFALDCDQAKQKEVEDQPRIPSPSVIEPDFISPTLREAVGKQVGTYQLRSQYVLDEALKGDKEAVLNVVRECGPMLQLAAPSLQKQKDVVLVAVEENFSAFQYADPLLRKDGEYVLTLMAIDPRVVWYADESLGENRDFILKAVKIYGLALQIADDSLKSEKEVVLTAVGQNGEAIRYAGLLGNDTDVLFTATRQLGHLVPGKTEIYLRALNIEFMSKWHIYPGMHSALTVGDEEGVISEVILNRIMLKADGRPLAIIVYPKVDWNEALRPNSLWGNSFANVEELRGKGYRVLYYEARTETDLYDAIRENGAAQKISVLLIAGHGTPETIDFGGNYQLRNEVYYLGFNDMNEMRELGGIMAEDCVVILASCSTGAGRWNIARALGRTWPQCGIFAPKQDSGGFGFRYNENNRVIGAAHCGDTRLPGGIVEFSCEEKFTTIVNR